MHNESISGTLSVGYKSVAVINEAAVCRNQNVVTYGLDQKNHTIRISRGWNKMLLK